MGNYSKLVAVLVGMVLPWLAQHGIDLMEFQNAIIGIIVQISQYVLPPALVFLFPANRE